MKNDCRKRLVLIGAVLLCALFAGCGKQVPVEESPAGETESRAETEAEPEPEEALEEIPEEPEELKVEISALPKSERKDADGTTTLLTLEADTVEAVIPGNPKAQEAVNSFFEKRLETYYHTADEYEEMAQEELEMMRSDAENGNEEERQLAQERMSYWNGYGLGLSMTVMRADESMISVLETYYEDTGGAHPNSSQCAYNFDTRTGELMNLEDIASDLDGLRTEAKDYLDRALQEPEYQDLLFSDYKSYLEDILTDTTWYMDEKGFHMICNEYIITPHAAGILEFIMPYEEAPAVKEEYIPKAGQTE